MIDTHTHINFPPLEHEASAVIERAKQAGVVKMIIPATSLETSRSGAVLSTSHEGVYSMAGVHPHDSKEFSLENQAAFEDLLEKERFVAIGEVGLDYYRFPEAWTEQEIETEKDQQKKVFQRMISYAKGKSLPLVIHSREAFVDIRDILREYASGHPTVIHCFTGTKEEAATWLDMGCMLSITGIITYKKSDELRAVVKDLPLDRLMIETDAPYLSPEGFRSQPCEPAFVVEVAKKLAEIKGLSVEEVDAVITANATQFFHLV